MLIVTFWWSAGEPSRAELRLLDIEVMGPTLKTSDKEIVFWEVPRDILVLSDGIFEVFLQRMDGQDVEYVQGESLSAVWRASVLLGDPSVGGGREHVDLVVQRPLNGAMEPLPIDVAIGGEYRLRVCAAYAPPEARVFVRLEPVLPAAQGWDWLYTITAAPLADPAVAGLVGVVRIVNWGLLSLGVVSILGLLKLSRVIALVDDESSR